MICPELKAAYERSAASNRESARFYREAAHVAAMNGDDRIVVFAHGKALECEMQAEIDERRAEQFSEAAMAA